MTIATSISKALLKLSAAAMLSLTIAGPSFAQDVSYPHMTCSELWYMRNLIYAEKGYCFKTRRARARFGPRCYPPYGRLSRFEAREVREIQRWERRKGCN